MGRARFACAASIAPTATYSLRTVRRAAEVAASLALLAASARVAPAQTVGGQVVQAMVLSSSNPPEGPIFANGVLVDGMSYLRHIPAKRAEEVRYLKREDAKIQYGMQFEYVILVKLRSEEP